MARAWQSIIVAVLGWAALCASGPAAQNSNREHLKNQRSIIESLEGIEATLKEPAAPEVTTEPCTDGRENRQSDLCAQWKAADAAQSAARASWLFGLMGSIIGGITMTAAISAALYARDAAREAKRGSDAAEGGLVHAQEVTSVQLRAYLFFRVKVINTLNTSNTMKLEYGLINTGQTPARNVRMFIKTSVVDPEPDAKIFRHRINKRASSGFIGAGTDNIHRRNIGLTADEAESIRDGTKEFYLFGITKYEDVLGTTHETRFRRRLYAKGGLGWFYATSEGEYAD